MCAHSEWWTVPRDPQQTFVSKLYPTFDVTAANRTSVDANGKVSLPFALFSPGTPEDSSCNPLRDVVLGTKEVFDATRQIGVRNKLTSTSAPCSTCPGCLSSRVTEQPSVVHVSCVAGTFPSVLHFNGT